MAVLPTPGSPISAGLFLVRRRQDLDDALDFLLAADDRVELAGARGGRQVDAQLVDGRRRLLARLVAWAVRPSAGCDRTWMISGANLVQADAEALEHAGGDAFALAHQAEEQVLGADVVVVQPARLVDRELDDLLGARRQPDLAHDRAGRPGR